jgi:hypothetical protein
LAIFVLISFISVSAASPFGSIGTVIGKMPGAEKLGELVNQDTSGAVIDLTGVWRCDDGGTYYIRQLDNTVWWYGEWDSANPRWSNVATGSNDGSRVTLRWADVPKGSIMGHGNLILQIKSKNELTAIQKTGGFGGSTWRR